jgi:hypothetical protein
MARVEVDPNYSSPTFSRATAGTDLFKKEDVQQLAAAMSTHDHTTGKGLVLPASAIPAGSITSTKIANDAIYSTHIVDGQVQTQDLAARAVTMPRQATGSTNSPTTTSTTMVDMPEMTMTFTPAVTSDVYIWFNGVITLAATGYCLAQLVIDGGAVALGYLTGPPSNGSTLTLAYLQQNMTAAAHTVKVQWSSPTGAVITAQATYRSVFVLETHR